MITTQNKTSDKPVIACIDDEARVLIALEKLFRPSFRVFYTTNPDEFITFIKENTVHVAISDQRMPDRLGVDLLKEIKHLSPNTMRVLLTGYADLKAVLSSINEGEIFRYLTKPFDADEVLNVITRAAAISIHLYKALPTPRPLTSVSDATTPASTTSKTTQAAKAAQANVLVIDDADGIQEMQEMFSDTINLTSTSNVEDAHILIEKNDIHVVISDIQVAGHTIAPELYNIKKRFKNVVILIQTNIKDATQLIDLINKGDIYRFLPKPIRMSLTRVSIDRAYKHHLELVTMPALTIEDDVEIVETNDTTPISGQVNNAVSLLKDEGFFR